ncbi:MAG: NAD(P)/FAD-dependent oxidoreductase [Dongiaceae bacterium]
MTVSCDFLIIGAGVSGAAAAYELAEHGRVIVLEMESAPGYHSTGRSAALYTRNFGNRVVRALNRASYRFFSAPPPGFGDQPLLSPRGGLTIGSADDRDKMDELLSNGAQDNSIVEVTRDRALELAPLLRPEAVAYATYEHGILDMDVAAIHQGFLKGLAARGGRVICNSPATALERRGGDWFATTPGETFSAPVIVNAAGAWADGIAELAGITPIGLVPKRRTAIIVDLPEGRDGRGWPLVDQAGYGCYCRPEAGRLMASPADETPVEPCDVQPEDLDVAIIADWLERVFQMSVRRIVRKWAGLRNFVHDQSPVAGFDEDTDGFFWLCGQGGYGIMLSPTLGRTAASLISKGVLPSDVREAGISMGDISPRRLRPA